VKFFVIFLLLFSISYSYAVEPIFYSRETDYYPEEDSFVKLEQVKLETLNTKEKLKLLKAQLNVYTTSVAMVLLNEKTPFANKIEIFEEMSPLPKLNGEIELALQQISDQGINYDDRVISENSIEDEKISVWIKAQFELIKRKQQAINGLLQGQRALNDEFYVNLALDFTVITIGAFLYFIPVVGPVIAIPLTTVRIALTGSKIGTALAVTGGARMVIDYYSYLDKGEQELVSFTSDLVLRSPLVKELLKIALSAKALDQYLLDNLLISPTKEVFIDKILYSIGNDELLSTTRQSAIRIAQSLKDDIDETKKRRL